MCLDDTGGVGGGAAVAAAADDDDGDQNAGCVQPAFSLFMSLLSQITISLILYSQVISFSHSSDSTVLAANVQFNVKLRNINAPILSRI